MLARGFCSSRMTPRTGRWCARSCPGAPSRSCGAHAWAVLADGPVDVLLLDMGLPDGNGMELAAELRDSRYGRPPAVIAVTGNSAAQQARAAIAAGCQAVLA